MSKISKQLIKAGLYYIIDTNKEDFLDKISVYLQDKSGLVNFLFDGPLPINDKIEKKIEEYLKATLPSPDYFDSIVSIEVDFDFSFEQIYKVTYKATRFYNQDKRPWQGNSVSDDTHPIPIITECTVNITHNNLT